MAFVAVLIDGDNLNAGHAEQVMSKARAVGTVSIARVYFDTEGDNGWADVPGIEPRVVRCAKNAGDIELALDAMEIGLSGRAQAFVIVSSDGGLAQVAYRLRALGHQVVGLGESKAPLVFRSACSDFHQIGSTALSPATCLDVHIRKLIAAHSVKGTGMRICDLAPLMHKKHNVKISGRPEKTWRGYFAARPEKYEMDPRGAEARVRFRP